MNTLEEVVNGISKGAEWLRMELGPIGLFCAAASVWLAILAAAGRV